MRQILQHMVHIHCNSHEKIILAADVRLSEKSSKYCWRLPFVGCKLFADLMDASLHTLKDSRATMRSLGICAPVNKRRFIRSQMEQRVCPAPYSTCRRLYELPTKIPMFSKKKLPSTTTDGITSILLHLPSPTCPLSGNSDGWLRVNHPVKGTLQLPHPIPSLLSDVTSPIFRMHRIM